MEVSALPTGRSDATADLPPQRALWLSALCVLSSAFSLGRDWPDGTAGGLRSDAGAGGENEEEEVVVVQEEVEL